MSRRSLYRRYRGISGHIADNPFGVAIALKACAFHIAALRGVGRRESLSASLCLLLHRNPSGHRGCVRESSSIRSFSLRIAASLAFYHPVGILLTLGIPVRWQVPPTRGSKRRKLSLAT
jgi:hypothetical protein